MDLYEKLRSLKMAVIEDDKLLRESMVLFFRSRGCVIAGFADADSAMPAIEKDPPDIVISDYILPGADGLSLLRQVGARRPETLRILVTGHPSPDITREVEKAGIDAFILKPFSIEEMEDALRRLLQGQMTRQSIDGKTTTAKGERRHP